MPFLRLRMTVLSLIRRSGCFCTSMTRRAFSSLPASRHVGPESPRYIQVPKPPQQTAPYTPIVKGFLPVPRNVFVTRSRLDKASEQFLNNATPAPSKEESECRGPHASYLAWKNRLSASRRKNLRQGIASLHKRKQMMDTYLAKRGAWRQNEQRRLISEPPRDDEVFTSPSVSGTVRRFLNGEYNAVSDVDVAKRRAATRSREAAKKERRKAALHTLYVHARDYIVTEDQLSDVIDDTFGTEDNLPGFAANRQQGRSIWARGQLLNTGQMLAASQGRGDKAVAHMSPEVLTRKRMVQIAEELTGGKIPLEVDRP